MANPNKIEDFIPGMFVVDDFRGEMPRYGHRAVITANPSKTYGKGSDIIDIRFIDSPKIIEYHIDNVYLIRDNLIIT